MSFSKHCKKIQKFREKGNLKHLHKNELDKVSFAHDAAYLESKDLTKRALSFKIFKDRAVEIARNCKYDGYQRALANMVYNFIDKKKQELEQKQQVKQEWV